jgi:hypothetical protein
MRDAPRPGRAPHITALTLAAAVLAATAVAAVAGGWTSRSGDASRLWTANPYVKLQESARPTPWKPALVAPRGGRAAFQVVLDRAAKAQPRPGVLRGPAGARLAAGAISIRRELSLPVTKTSSALSHGLLGEVPDPLVPVSAKPQPGTRQVFWVSIDIPRTQAAGPYRGSIQVGLQSLAYSLRVADVTLPRERALHTWFLVWGSHADDAEHRDGAAAAYTRALARYGIGDGTAAGGDAAIGVPPDMLEGGESDATLQQLARGVARAAERLRSTRPGAAPYSYVFDEPPSNQLGEVERWGKALAAAAPAVRQLVTATTDPDLGHTVGAWSMHLGALTPETLATTHRLGAEAWVYSSCCESPGSPTLLLDQHAVANLAVAPASWLQGGRGLLYWSVNDYTGDPYRDPLNHGEDEGRTSNGDGVLLYPGRPFGQTVPNPSLRLALVAAGLQITDEAAMLARRGHGDEARALLRRVLPGTAEYVDNPASWQNIERMLLQRLEATS